MFISKNNKNILYVVIILGLVSLVLSAYLGEDSLGGARHDYLFHEKFIIAFSENFKQTINQYGNNFEVRNSPIFYIYSSLFVKNGVKIEYLKYFNLIIIIPLIIFFIKSIDLKFKDISIQAKSFLILLVFLSPTIRSLSAWPYPLSWAICFFLISIYYFLKFEKSKNNHKKIKYSLINILFLALSAYFTPNFSIFAIFYLFYFLKYFKLSNQSILIIFTNIILSLPAIFFLIHKDFYIFKHEADYVIQNYSIYDTINVANKIIIITSIIFFFFIPFVKIENLKLNFFSKANIYLGLFIIINIIFFNFSKGLGGGLFYHLSNMFSGGPYLLFFIFILALLIFKNYGLFNPNNIFLFFLLIFYNIQSTIYLKYYDPIILFIFLFLIKTKIHLKLETLSLRCVIFYLFFLSISFGKKFIVY